MSILSKVGEGSRNILLRIFRAYAGNVREIFIEFCIDERRNMYRFKTNKNDECKLQMEKLQHRYKKIQAKSSG